MDCTRQAPLSMGFSRLEHWSGLSFPSPGALPDPGTEPVSPASAGGFSTAEPLGKSVQCLSVFYNPQCFFKKILSIIYIYIFFLFFFFLFQILFLIGYYEIPSLFPCAVQ